MPTFDPDRVEQVSLFQLPTRLGQLKAQFVPERSTKGRQLYWQPKGRSKTDGVWIMVTARRGVATLGFYPMERCPCEDA
jgi:hypothetical protein